MAEELNSAQQSAASAPEQDEVQGYFTPVPIPLPNPDAPALLPLALFGLAPTYLGLKAPIVLSGLPGPRPSPVGGLLPPAA
jgi:hypothetical protein